MSLSDYLLRCQSSLVTRTTESYQHSQDWRVKGDVLWGIDEVEGGNSEDDTRQGDKL
jgi:hypothetical protein